MKGLNDPRLPFYFTTDPTGKYSGGIPGNGATFSIYSHVTDAQQAPDAPYDILSYAQVEFTKAEAAERGMNVGGTAQEHYNNAVTASIEEWGGSAAQAATYLAQPSVNYTTAPGTYKQKIATQEYIALYNNGFDAWTMVRRLDYPTLPEPTHALSGFPVRFTYPILEQNINTSNYNAGASAIGGDVVEKKLFWDKF